ncbi:hypothetical protein IFM89_018106 [Coptis chinensis]|uniref:DUF7887 domain-containing protein n=1 Tax=Coptis chinensis TaxID=261450 RepID=A0A835IEL5_9MAGN|nr:hypothetical protein IFM89_018106 [Coptis chinensis]
MVTTQNGFLFSTPSTSLVTWRNSRKLKHTLAKKQDSTDNFKSQQQQPFLTLRVPNVFIARSVIAVLGLGFIDAGYSGDWSRIGAISKEFEESLRLAAYLVTPLCLFLIFSFTKEQEGA